MLDDNRAECILTSLPERVPPKTRAPTRIGTPSAITGQARISMVPLEMFLQFLPIFAGMNLERRPVRIYQAKKSTSPLQFIGRTLVKT
jgi:hypothetical protein